MKPGDISDPGLLDAKSAVVGRLWPALESWLHRDCGCEKEEVLVEGPRPKVMRWFRLCRDAAAARALQQQRQRPLLRLGIPRRAASGRAALLDDRLEPERLQAAIRAVFRLATRRIRIAGVDVVPVPLYNVLDPNDYNDYVQRVEPSQAGGKKIAAALMDAIYGAPERRGSRAAPRLVRHRSSSMERT